MHRTEGIDYTTEDGKRRYIDPNLPAVRGTVLNAESMNSIQEEICNVIEKAGLTLNASAALDRTDGWDQLWAAITSRGIIGTAALANLGVTREKLAAGAVDGTKASSATAQTILFSGEYQNGDPGVARAGYTTGTSSKKTGLAGVGMPHTTGNTLPRPSTIVNGSTKYSGKYYNQGILISSNHNVYIMSSEIDGTYVNDDVEIFIGTGVHNGTTIGDCERCYHVWYRTDHTLNGEFNPTSWVCVQANTDDGSDLLKYKSTSRINGNDSDGSMTATLNGSEDIVLLTNWYDAGGGSFVNDVANCEVVLDSDMPYGKTTHISLYSKCRTGFSSAQLKITGQVSNVYSPTSWNEFDGYGKNYYYENLAGLTPGDAFIMECDVTRVHDMYPVPGYLVTNFTKRKL